MNQTVFTVKIDQKLKREAKKVAEDLGFTLSALVKGYFKDLVRRKAVSFSVEETLKPSPYLERALKEAEKEYKEGWVSPSFNKATDAIAWLNNPKRKYVRDLQSNVHKK